MSTGFTMALYQRLLALQETEPDNAVYRLGILCAVTGTSIAEAANRIGVTRAALYGYMAGDYKPKAEPLKNIKRLNKSLEVKGGRNAHKV